MCINEDNDQRSLKIFNWVFKKLIWGYYAIYFYYFANLSNELLIFLSPFAIPFSLPLHCENLFFQLL
jgi:hypothetical protein